ncbi:M14 family zinc carboxypeptidase [Thermospira aquatica]|uniref:Peptidase M14 domain-containing protein n=1 Tax=Thermospira aquatica TaxID=2828656 RepID=A0AAX3BBB0_9SPIR|nr:M14 family zinc carboxypeptidase [Thermospira aquatica]URA09390.1 hypothetical protein KDW03_07795 [Thermospira aquatica]
MPKFILLLFFPILIGWADEYQPLRKLFDFDAYEARILSLTNLPGIKVFSIGKSHGGRNLWMIEITPRQSSDYNVLFLGSAHPIEWHAQEIPLRLAEYLATNRQNLRATCYVLPIFNPDGFAYMRVIPVFYASNRKNRYFPQEEKRPHVYTAGVDLNRNFSYHWQKTSSDPTHPYYSGSAPMSEPETQALDRFVSSVKLSYVISFHTPGNVVQYPWGYTKSPQTNTHLIAFAHWMASNIGRGYRARQDSANYLKPGCEIDWFYGEKKIPAIRLEISKKLIDPDLEDYPAIQNAIKAFLCLPNPHLP